MVIIVINCRRAELKISAGIWFFFCFFWGGTVLFGTSHLTAAHDRSVWTYFVARIACWLERWTCDWKVVSSNPSRSGGRICFSSQLCVPTLIRCPVHPRVTAVARKRSRLFCQKCRWQVTTKHAYSWPTKSSGLTMPLSKHSVGTYQETNSHATHQGTLGQSSQLAKPLWTDSSLKSGISVRKLSPL